MALEAKFKIEKPDEVVATLSITMSVKEWCELRDQLSDRYPSWRFSSAINNLVNTANKVFRAEHEVQP